MLLLTYYQTHARVGRVKIKISYNQNKSSDCGHLLP